MVYEKRRFVFPWIEIMGFLCKIECTFFPLRILWKFAEQNYAASVRFRFVQMYFFRIFVAVNQSIKRLNVDWFGMETGTGWSDDAAYTWQQRRILQARIALYPWLNILWQKIPEKQKKNLKISVIVG